MAEQERSLLNDGLEVCGEQRHFKIWGGVGEGWENFLIGSTEKALRVEVREVPRNQERAQVTWRYSDPPVAAGMEACGQLPGDKVLGHLVPHLERGSGKRHVAPVP